MVLHDGRRTKRSKSESPKRLFVHMSNPPSARLGSIPQRDHIGLTFLTFLRSFAIGPDLRSAS